MTDHTRNSRQSRRTGFAPSLLAHRDIERVMDALDGAFPFPTREIVPHRALRRQVLRQRAPLAAGRKHVEYRVQHFAHIYPAWPAAVLRWPDQRRHQRPFRIRQVRRIPQPTPVRRTPMFCRPRHPSAPANRPQKKRITSDSADSTPFRMGSKSTSIPACHIIAVIERRKYFMLI